MRKPKQSWFAGLFKSIPVINRLSTPQWFFQGTTRTLMQTIGQQTVENPYQVNPWVRGAIESVALNVGGTPLTWKNSRGTKASERDAAPWVSLFEKPGSLLGQSQLFEATIVYLLHYGECMWILDRKEPTAMPTGIEPFNGKSFEAVTDKEGNLLRWKIETTLASGEKKVYTFEKWEVCFFRMVNPYDRLRGLAPLDAAQLGIDQDQLASQYNKAFFKNSAMPGGVIEVEEEMTEEAFNRMAHQFQEHHSGVSKAHILAILEGGAKYKQMVPSQKDMEFQAQKSWNRDEILACFKVPKLELGIWDNVNFSIAKVQAREFWVKTLLPKMKLIEYVMWTQLFSVTGTGKIFADFDISRIDALQGEMVEKVDMSFKLWGMGVPLNILIDRFELGIEKPKNGDTSYVTNNTFRVDEKGVIQLPVPAVDPNAQAAAAAALATANAAPKGNDNAKP